MGTRNLLNKNNYTRLSNIIFEQVTGNWSQALLTCIAYYPRRYADFFSDFGLW